MNSESARGHVSKLLLDVAIDLGLNLIVKTLILYSEFVCLEDRSGQILPMFFTLKLDSFIGFPR